jgi:translation initiation factor IF-3
MSIETKRYRINYQIRVPSVRVSQNNNQLGVMPVDKARNLAMEQGLDLIEISPNTHPPVCIIADFGKFKYENKLKDKENKKKQKNSMVVIKEIRLTPTIGEHDFQTKMNAIEKFINDNKKVQIVMKFTPRELLHKDIGIQKINQIVDYFQDKIVIEMSVTFVDRRLLCRIAPKTSKL